MSLTLNQQLLHKDFEYRMQKATPEELLDTAIKLHRIFFERENQHKAEIKLAARI